MFRISWRSNLTGYTGNGQYCYSDTELLESHIAALNEKYPNFHHWIEGAPDTDRTTTRYC